jgi:hypothetical protein
VRVNLREHGIQRHAVLRSKGVRSQGADGGLKV